MTILALSGSLRRGSVNTALLHAAVALAPPGVTVRVLDRVGDLPPFSPDDDPDRLPPPVQTLVDAVASADAVLVACPEYAHGVPGAFKNALDWTVATPVWMGRPVALLNAAPVSHHGADSLAETLRRMDARVVAEVRVPGVRRTMDRDALVAASAVAAALRDVLDTLVRAAPATGL